eukprot:3924348-Pyramimonas_sp.AAC.1
MLGGRRPSASTRSWSSLASIFGSASCPDRWRWIGASCWPESLTRRGRGATTLRHRLLLDGSLAKDGAHDIAN